jgi:hypothetical protein
MILAIEFLIVQDSTNPVLQEAGAREQQARRGRI